MVYLLQASWLLRTVWRFRRRVPLMQRASRKQFKRQLQYYCSRVLQRKVSTRRNCLRGGGVRYEESHEHVAWAAENGRRPNATHDVCRLTQRYHVHVHAAQRLCHTDRNTACSISLGENVGTSTYFSVEGETYRQSPFATLSINLNFYSFRE